MDKKHWLYKEFLRPVFKHEAIVIIVKGFWKHGKTNVGLMIAEWLLATGLVKIAATNIKITETDKIKFVQDFETLKDFHFDDTRNPKHKVFIFDEAGKLTVKRRAMGKLNVEWMKFLPELSKGRTKLLVITQAEFLTDTIFTDTEFTRAIITCYKHEGNKFSIMIESELLIRTIGRPRMFINNFPKCETEYSPYEPAEWFLERQDAQKETADLVCCKIARLYAVENINSTKIANKLGYKSRTEVIRLLKRHLRHTLRKPTREDVKDMLTEYDIIERGEEIPALTV